MKAIFNKNCVLVGWYETQNKNVFNNDMQWIGFINNGYFFSKTAHWLGGFINGTYVDVKGRPVAWNEGSTPVGVNILPAPIVPMIPLQPLSPLHPLKPLTPMRPLIPLGGWSELEWNDYINR